MVLVLYKIDRLDNIGVMESRRNAKLRGKLLDVLLFSLILSTFPELLENKKGSEGGRRISRHGRMTVP